MSCASKAAGGLVTHLILKADIVLENRLVILDIDMIRGGVRYPSAPGNKIARKRQIVRLRRPQARACHADERVSLCTSVHHAIKDYPWRYVGRGTSHVRVASPRVSKMVVCELHFGRVHVGVAICVRVAVGWPRDD
eukprot:5306308-Prymnesium_polylepis.1